MGFNVAIDGPAGAGKSTIAKEIAGRLNYIYVDTGAMYRAMALFLLRQGITAGAQEELERCCHEADISIAYNKEGEQVVLLNGEQVNGLIRTQEVGNMASAVARNGEVRKKLVALQQSLAKSKDVIMDGRDIGTCVLPEADLKIYLTADSGVRAERRFAELRAKGQDCDRKTIEEEILHRDKQDMEREISPLVQAEDAVLVDSSRLSIQEVVESIIKMVEERQLQQG